MNKNIFRRVIQTILTLVLQSVILFISAGTYRWIWAWMFIVTGVVILVINFMVLPQEVIEERGTWSMVSQTSKFN